MDIQKMLFELQDFKFKSFHSKLIPDVDADSVIGVKTPHLRKIAKELRNSSDLEKWLEELPHKYYEENNIHAFVISETCDFDNCITQLRLFLPYVDNWATCDGIRPKCFKNNPDKLHFEIKKWLRSYHTYTVRFGIEMLMVHFLDEKFDKEYLKLVAQVKSDEYYINMMIAWYFATALAKQWNDTIFYIEQKLLPVWVHNKTIRKAVESYRITDMQKDYLKKLKQ